MLSDKDREVYRLWLGLRKKQKQEAALAVENCRRLIAKVAWSVWRKLPAQTKVWLSIEDMISDAVWWAQHYVWPRWSAKGGASFSSYLHHQLFPFFENAYLATQLSQKRYDGKTVSIQALQERLREEGKVFDWENIVGMKLATPDPLVACHVTKVFPKMYNAASHQLQGQMVDWFLEQHTKFHTQGAKFKRAKGEFLKLAYVYNVGLNDCLHLVRSPVCLDRVCRDILGIPYDFSYPAPEAERMPMC